MLQLCPTLHVGQTPHAGSQLAGIYAEQRLTSTVPRIVELNLCFTSLAQQGRVRSSPDIYRTALSLIACLRLVCRAIKAPLV